MWNGPFGYWTSWFQKMCCLHRRNWFVGKFEPPFAVSESQSTSWISLQNTLNSPRPHLLNKVLLAHTILHILMAVGSNVPRPFFCPASPFQAPRVESMLTSKLPLLTQPHCSEHIIYLLGLRDHFRIFSKACETFHPADCWGSWSWSLAAPRSRVVRLSLHARQLVCALASVAHGGFWEQTKTGGLKAV